MRKLRGAGDTWSSHRGGTGGYHLVTGAALPPMALDDEEAVAIAIGDPGRRVRDPYGHLWWIQTRIEEVSADELARRRTEPKWVAGDGVPAESHDTVLRLNG